MKIKLLFFITCFFTGQLSAMDMSGITNTICQDTFDSLALGTVSSTYSYSVYGGMSSFRSSDPIPYGTTTVTNYNGGHALLFNVPSGSWSGYKIKMDKPYSSQTVTIKFNLQIQSTNSGYGLMYMCLPTDNTGVDDWKGNLLVVTSRGQLGIVTNRNDPVFTNRYAVLSSFSHGVKHAVEVQLSQYYNPLSSPTLNYSVIFDGSMIVTNHAFPNNVSTTLFDSVRFGFDESLSGAYPTSGNQYVLDNVTINGSVPPKTVSLSGMETTGFITNMNTTYGFGVQSLSASVTGGTPGNNKVIVWVDNMWHGYDPVAGVAFYEGTNTIYKIEAYNMYGSMISTNVDYKVIQLGPNTDTNGDGIPDVWQIQYYGQGGHPFFTTSWLSNPNSAALADPDHDGATNYDEWRAGTCPTDKASCLKLETRWLSPQNNMMLKWKPVQGMNYTIEMSTDLSNWYSITNIIGPAPQWYDVRDPKTGLILYVTNMYAEIAWTDFDDASTGGKLPRKFYRLKVP